MKISTILAKAAGTALLAAALASCATARFQPARGDAPGRDFGDFAIRPAFFLSELRMDLVRNYQIDTKKPSDDLSYAYASDTPYACLGVALGGGVCVDAYANVFLEIPTVVGLDAEDKFSIKGDRGEFRKDGARYFTKATLLFDGGRTYTARADGVDELRGSKARPSVAAEEDGFRHEVYNPLGFVVRTERIRSVGAGKVEGQKIYAMDFSVEQLGPRTVQVSYSSFLGVFGSGTLLIEKTGPDTLRIVKRPKSGGKAFVQTVTISDNLVSTLGEDGVSGIQHSIEPGLIRSVHRYPPYTLFQKMFGPHTSKWTTKYGKAN